MRRREARARARHRAVPERSQQAGAETRRGRASEPERPSQEGAEPAERAARSPTRPAQAVPTRALRLVVFEKMPWPRPDILHRERRVHLSGGDPKSYDDRIVRLRLRQAFGRLIRRGSDRGVFVLLDRQTPTRLLSAFPAGVIVRRVGLKQAAEETRAFLAEGDAG